MTSKLVVNTIESDTGISSVSFASSISMSSTSKFHFSAAGIDIGADTNINRPEAGVLGFNINSSEKLRITSAGKVGIGTNAPTKKLQVFDSSATSTTARDNTVARFLSNASNADCNIQISNGIDHSAQIGINGNGAEVYIAQDGNERLRIDLNGHLLPGTDNNRDLGSSTKRWRNLYTGDLQLSNVTPTSNGGEPVGSGGNEVDGTEGTWTIQEGLNDLFLINRINNKKYKFNLTEVT